MQDALRAVTKASSKFQFYSTMCAIQRVLAKALTSTVGHRKLVSDNF